jgi:hypothetical protein
VNENIVPGKKDGRWRMADGRYGDDGDKLPADRL